MSEALAEDGNYSAVGFTYGSDYYDPSEPTEEEEPSKQRGEGKEGPSLVGSDHSTIIWDTSEGPLVVGARIETRS